MPRFLKTRVSSFEISSSSTGTTRGKNSRIVTSVPKLRKIDANSTPTAPAPITTSDLGGALKRQNFDIGQDRRVRLQSRQQLGLRARRHNHVLRLHRAFHAARVHVHRVHAVFRRPRQPSKARNNRDLVFLHQELEALHVLGDDGVLAREHRGPIERRRADARNAELRRVLQVVPHLGVEQQRLGGNAAHMQAGAAQLGAGVDQRDLQPVLRPANRRRITGRPAADHRHVVNRL